MLKHDKVKDLSTLKINDKVRIQPIHNKGDSLKSGKVVEQVNQDPILFELLTIEN